MKQRYAILLSLLISVSPIMSSDGTKGWIISMAKTAGTFALKAIGTGVLGGHFTQYPSIGNSNDRKDTSKTSVPTGSARDEEPRGLESTSHTTSSTSSSRGVAREIRNGQVIEYYTNHQSAINGYREEYKNQTNEQLQDGIKKTESIVQSAQSEVNYRRRNNDKAVLKEAEEHLNFWQQTLADQQSELNSRNKPVPAAVKKQATHTLAQATAMVLTTQTTGTTSTTKSETVNPEEQQLVESIKARELQSYKWKYSPWPTDWFVTHGTAREYEKVTNSQKEKLASIRTEKFNESRNLLHKYEGERQEENSKKMLEHRNNGGGNGGGDKDPKKDPMGPVKAGVGTGLVRETRKGGEHPEPHNTPKPEHHEVPQIQPSPSPTHVPQDKIIPELNRPYSETGVLPTYNPHQDRRDHIWRDDRGHFNKETDKSKQAMAEVIMDPANFIGESKGSGNLIYAGPSKTCDGQQVYVQTRNGQIVDAGINKTEWTREQLLTNKRPTAAKNDPSQFWTLVGGAVGLEAITSSSDAEASEIKGKLNVPSISTQQQEFKLPEAPGSDLKLPEAPKESKPHFTTQTNGPLLTSGLDVSKMPKIDFTKSPIGATSNKEIFKLSPETVAILNKTTTPSTSLLKPSDSKPAMPTFTLPAAPATSKPSVSPSRPSSTSTPKLSLPSTPSKSSSSSSTYKPSSSYKPTSFTGSKPTFTTSFGGSKKN